MCLKCNNTKFSIKKIWFYLEIKGENVPALSSAFACDECSEPLMDTEQMKALTKAVVEECINKGENR